MRLIALAGAALFALGGCSDESASIFGRSYDECVLINAKGSEGDANLVEPACRRRFEVPSQSGARAFVSARLADQFMIFQLMNDDSSKIITAVQVDVELLDRSGKALETRTWNFSTFVEPGRQVRLKGDNYSVAQARSAGRATVTVLREIPIKRPPGK